MRQPHSSGTDSAHRYRLRSCLRCGLVEMVVLRLSAGQIVSKSSSRRGRFAAPWHTTSPFHVSFLASLVSKLFCEDDKIPLLFDSVVLYNS
jgi:hypothetical protein